MPAIVLWIAVIIIAISAAGLIFSRDWRWSLLMLAGQYFGAFLLVLVHWPLTMSAAKLVAGWMSVAILGMTRINVKDSSQPRADNPWPQGRVFRFFAISLVFVSVIFASRGIEFWLPDAGAPVIIGAAILIGMGLLHLGVTARPLYVTLGLLTVLCGFEILYSSIENSILVAGFLAAINLGLALTGVYLLTLDNEEETA